MISIREQCRKLYLDAFNDDETFTDLLFDNSFDDCCYYLSDGESVVSMLFAFDVFLNGVKGKYIYGVATDEKYRGKGYMRKLFALAEEKLKGEYKFLCLRPMDEELFEFYDKLGFIKKFYKSKFKSAAAKVNNNCVLVKTTDEFSNVRKSLLQTNFVELGDNLSFLLMSYCDVYTDCAENPQFLAVREKESGRVKEVIGKAENIPEMFSGENIYTVGNDFCYAVYKSLGYDFDGNAYLGLAMD